MRVFLTGATGFIGSAIVNELIGAGHQVTGLARSKNSAEKLLAAGAKVIEGDIENLDALRRGASAADGAIHTAFYHQIGQIPFATRLRVMAGGAPSGIVNRFLEAAVGADRRALETMGKALAGPDRPLVAAFAAMAMRAGKLASEDDAVDPNSVGGPRGSSETTMRDLALAGVRTSVIRLSPIVHGPGDRGGLAPQLFKIVQKKHESGYVGDGLNRWAAVHVLDAARLFRLALEKGPAGGTYHGVAEEGIPFERIADLIGKRLSVPVTSKSTAEAAKQFGFLSPFVGADNPVSSALTQQRLGWTPIEQDALSDFNQPSYF